MNHPTFIQLQEYLDTGQTGLSNSDISMHLRSCKECGERVASLREMDKAIRNAGRERVSAQFTQRVMKQLGIEYPASFAWYFFRNLAPLFALSVIVGIIFIVFQLSGTFQNPHVQQSVSSAQSLYGKTSGTLSEYLERFNEGVQKYFSFAFAKNTYGLTLFMVLFIGAVALLDRYLLIPMMKRKM